MRIWRAIPQVVDSTDHVIHATATVEVPVLADESQFALLSVPGFAPKNGTGYGLSINKTNMIIIDPVDKVFWVEE